MISTIATGATGEPTMIARFNAVSLIVFSSTALPW
jgi:hypothetical protein